MAEVFLAHPDDFLKVRETLTRIGVSSKNEKKLFQSCHILHKQGRYFIVHFKELFLLDGKEANLDQNDILRRNRIAKLLSDWNLVTLADPDGISENLAPMTYIKVLPYREKRDWQLVAKYEMGHRRPSKRTYEY